MTYSEKLNKLKDMLFLTQASLAFKLGVNRSQLTRWLDGNIPSRENMDKIDKLYNKTFNTA